MSWSMLGLPTAPAISSEEAELLAELDRSLDRFLTREVRSDEIDRTKEIPRSVLAGLREMGLFGLSIPRDLDGAGFSLAALCACTARLARHDRSVATTVGLHLGLGTRGLVAFGAPHLREHYLPRLASGEWIAAFATTEPGAGSDLSAVSTTAVLDGDRLKVNGQKSYVTNAHLADVITMTASTPGLGGARRGHSLILMERSDRGVELGSEEDKLGIRGSSTASVYVDDASIPLERVIGSPGKGMEHLSHVLAWGRTLMSAGCVGAADLALSKTLDHVSTRRQFGKSLSSLDVVKAQLADMTAVLFAMGALVSHTSAAEHDRELLLLRSIATKVFCSEGNWEVTDLALQLHGGSGFIEETGMALLVRDARVTRIFEGANDVLLIHLGTLAAARSSQAEQWRQGERLDLGRAALQIHDALETLRAQLRETYGIQLMKHSRELHRLGTLAVLSEASRAVVVRAQRDGSDAAVQFARHWLAMAQSRAASLAREGPAMSLVESVCKPLLEVTP